MTHKRRTTLWRQLGQSMAEYTVVMAALVGGLLVANRGACPSEYDDCIQYLLTTLHDNYGGYSSSISALHEYQTDYQVAPPGPDWTEDPTGDTDPGGSTGGGGTPELEPGVTEGTILTSSNGTENLGDYDSDTGVVTKDGVFVGTYDAETGMFEANDGSIVKAASSNATTDENGNILQRVAVSDCGNPPGVIAFGYISKTDETFYDSLQRKEADIGNKCTEAAYKVTSLDGSEDGGRIVDGYYYAVTTTPAAYLDTGVKDPEGEVVYFDFGGASGVCTVMAMGWDSGIDTDDLSNEEIYAEQLKLFKETDENESTVIGYMDADYYRQQMLFGDEPAAENNCVSNRVISSP